MPAQRLGQARRIIQRGGQDIEDTLGIARLLCKIRQRQRSERRLGRGLGDHGAPGGQRGGSLPQDHGDGEVPGHQRRDHAEGLLDGEDPPARRRALEHGAVRALGLAHEPPREARGVVDLALGLGEGLARLVGEDGGQVVLVVLDQRVPSGQQLRAGAGRRLAERFERRVCGTDCVVDVFLGLPGAWTLMLSVWACTFLLVSTCTETL